MFYNNTVGTLRHIFEIAIKAGARFDKPARLLKKLPITPKELKLPEPDQFKQMVDAIALGGGRFSQDCADLVRFLAYGGFRKTEAACVAWHDCNFTKGEITVRGHAETGTKNSEIRIVPLLPDRL